MRKFRRGTTCRKRSSPSCVVRWRLYAGFLEYADHHVGRLLDGLKKLNILDDTLVYYIFGDNGASAEGSLNGAYNEMANFNGLAALETPEFLMERYDRLGGPESYNHYAVGWAHAMNPLTSGPNRSPPTGAGPATAPSCTGLTASRPKAKSARSSTTS